jgi:hypothetical protein
MLETLASKAFWLIFYLHLSSLFCKCGYHFNRTSTMNWTFTLLFFIVKSKEWHDNTVPVYIRITIDGQRAEIATKKYTTPEQWNQVAQKVTGNSENDKIN